MSLLKRIEQGQGGSVSAGQPADNQGGEGSRLSSLQARTGKCTRHISSGRFLFRPKDPGSE